MAKIFLSHASEDKPLVRRIADDLKRAGHTVWLDEWEIHVGHSIPIKIQTGLEQSNFVVVVLTQHSVESGWVEKEWQSRIGREITSRYKHVEILPIKVDDCTVPTLLSDKKYANFKKYDVGISELLASITYHQQTTLNIASDTKKNAPKGKRAKIVFPVLAALVTVAIFLFFHYRISEAPQTQILSPENNTQKSYKHTIVEQHNPRNDQNRPLSQIRGDEVEAEVVANAWDSGVQAQIRLTGVPPSTDVYLSTDGVSYEKKSTSANLNLKNINRDELYIKLVSRADGSIAGPFVKHGVLTHALKNAFEGLTSRDSTELVKCSPTGCEIQRQILCASGAKFLKLGRKSTSYEFIYDLDKCAGPKLAYLGACFSTPNQIFPLRPGAILFANMEYEDVFKIPFQIVVANSSGEFNSESGKWIELETLKNEQPFAAARLGEVYGPFEIFLGAGGCYPINKDITAFLYDIDGHGLVEASMYGQTAIQFAIPNKPSRSEISIAFDHVSGQRVGPFSYRFDADKIIKASAKDAEPPRLSCTWKLEHPSAKKHWKCVAPGRASMLSWLDVSGIAYGSTETQLIHVIPISVTSEDVLSVPVGQWPQEDKIVSFDLPIEWTNLYYHLIFSNKSATPTIRIPLF